MIVEFDPVIELMVAFLIVAAEHNPVRARAWGDEQYRRRPTPSWWMAL